MTELNVRTPPKAGTTIAGRYKLVRTLPASPLGWRFLALDTALDTTAVQMTLLYPHHVAQRDTLDRIQQETLANRQLVHPNIAQIFDFDFAESGQPFICSEYLSGVTLRELLNRAKRERLPEDEALQILTPVAQALAYSHRKGFVHGGLEPGVIHILETGIVKLSDFGCARALHTSNGLTRTGETAFLPEYLAPEQLLQQEPDPSSDLYSFGCIAYELVTGSPPFRDDSFLRLTQLHRSTSADELPIRQTASSWLADLVLTCCEPTTAGRTVSAEEIASRLSAESGQKGSSRFLRTAAQSNRRRKYSVLPTVERLLSVVIALLLIFWLFDQNSWRSFPVSLFLRLERAVERAGAPNWTLLPLRAFLQTDVSVVDVERNAHIRDRHLEVDCSALADSWYDLSQKVSDGTPLLHLLANSSAHHQCLRYGVQVRGWSAYLDARDRNGNSALHVAALRGDALSAAFLINLGMNLHAINNAGETPLTIALARVDRPVLKAFVDAKASKQIPWGKATLVYTYMNTRDPDTIEIGLEDDAGMRPLNDGTTPLIHAIQLGLDPEALGMLTEAKLGTQRTAEGQDALFAAVQAGSLPWVERLLSAGFSPRVHDIHGDTPLHAATRMGLPAIVRALLKGGATVDETDGRGRTARMIATETGRQDLEEILAAQEEVRADAVPASSSRADGGMP